MKKLLKKAKEKNIYNRIVRIALSCEFDSFHNRHTVDLQDGYLFYFPLTGKISTTKKGLVFRSKNDCWFTMEELNELLNQIES